MRHLACRCALSCGRPNMPPWSTQNRKASRQSHRGAERQSKGCAAHGPLLWCTRSTHSCTAAVLCGIGCGAQSDSPCHRVCPGQTGGQAWHCFTTCTLAGDVRELVGGLPDRPAAGESCLVWPAAVCQRSMQRAQCHAHHTAAHRVCARVCVCARARACVRSICVCACMRACVRVCGRLCVRARACV